MEVYSGFKTHPCINVKNGCLEEIPAKLDALRAHDQNCIFQMVPCPKMDCKETLIVKDLDQHLKQAHKNDVISIFYGTEKNEFTPTRKDKPEIFGIYKRQTELVNGQSYYEKKEFGIWFILNEWVIGNSKSKGKPLCYAKVKRGIPFPDSTTNWHWEWFVSSLEWFTKANKGLGVKVLSFDSTKEWNFEGTKEELLESFCCLNAYGRQFYPQFKEVNGYLIFRTLMCGFQEETIPFQTSITFFNENDKPWIFFF
jgi:hypothetical protein